MKIRLKQKKPRNMVAKDLFTPKYHMRVVLSKKREIKRVNSQQLIKQVDE